MNKAMKKILFSLTALLALASCVEDTGLDVYENQLYLTTSEKTRLLYDRLASELSGKSELSVLSMGMSGDYVPAILEGANLVRVGSALFGARRY